MTEEKAILASKEQSGPYFPQPTVVEIETPPPITETSLVITAVLVIGAYLLFGIPGLIAGVFLIVAYLKLKKGEHEKAILYNRIARVVAIIFLSVGICTTVLCVAILLIYYAIIIPSLIAK